MKVDRKDLEELYDFIDDLFYHTSHDISERYYWELWDEFETIKARIEAE